MEVWDRSLDLTPELGMDKINSIQDNLWHKAQVAHGYHTVMDKQSQ